MPHTTQLFLGIDAGGTKTHALIADGEGRARGFGRAGAGNWESVGLDGAERALRESLAAALAGAGVCAADIAAAGYALAGFDWPSDGERLAPLLAGLGVGGPHTLVNDTIAALRAGSRDSCGVVVIAGTGSTVAGRSRSGKEFRTFGLGQLWGDFGGAEELVHAGLRATGHAYSGRGRPTALTGLFLEAYGAADVPELAERISRGEAEWPNGRLAPLVFQAATAGDAVACEIVRAAGRDLGENAAAVARRLDLADEEFDLVMAGGVFRSGSALLIEALAEPVRAYAPRACPVVLEAPPVVGSVLLAMDLAGLPPRPEVRARLAAEAAAMA